MTGKNISKEVYLPAEDSFLLEQEISKTNLSGKTCLDLGTGSGIQAIAMIKAGAKFVVCVDINKEALKQSRENVESYLASRKTLFPGQIWFIEGDLFENLQGWRFDFVAFNPPYVPSEKIKWADLDGGEKGRATIDKFMTQFVGQLSPSACVFLLVSSLNAPQEIISLLKKKGFLAKVIARKKLFFEELFVLRIERVSD